MKKLFVLLSICALMLTACGAEKTAEQADQADTSAITSGSVFADANSDITLDGNAVILAGVTFTPTSGWTDLGPSGMRKANYTFGPVDDEGEAASVAVYYFGKDQGGTIEANLARWVSQIGAPESGDKSEIRNEFTVDGMTISTVEVKGVYNSSMASTPSGTPTIAENFSLVGAVVSGPEGNIFFKLTGPDKTASEMAKGLVAMINGTHK